ncbi:MAG: hypothetical protein HYX67_03590 [Candidatus Melainabacteria bacterium]|nr:hypothetical protein [Candidatus Melainabacteria bacterium]
MYRKLAPLLVLCLSLQVLGTLSPATASETREDVIEALRATELQNGPTDGLSDKALSEVALLSKTVEAKRDIYARALELYIERIGAGKDVDQALIDYERAEISLAAEWKATRKVLEVIKKQDHLAHEWKHHRTLHPDRHTVDHHSGHPSDRNAAQNADHHSYNNSANANKPQANGGAGDIFY